MKKLSPTFLISSVYGIDFSKKIYENLFCKWEMPLGYMKVGMGLKKQKAYF